MAWLLIAVVACDTGNTNPKPAPTSAPALAMKNGADGLKAFFEASHAACTSKDFKKGRQLTLSLVPNRDELEKLFKDDVAADKIAALADTFKELPPSDEAVACVFYPGQGRTEIKVHTSTVEDLAAYKEHTPAFEEFPGGARRLAEKYLKGGTTFYEVEVTEPGKDMGTKFHMFFWDGTQWRMLGQAWRLFRE